MTGTVVDVILLIALLLAAVVGVSRGLLASAGALAGLAAAGVGAWWLLPLVSQTVPWPAVRGVVVAAAGVALLLGGAGIGSAIGGMLRRGADRIRLQPLDRLLGGALSVVVAALALSLVGQSVAVTAIPGVSSAIASSQVLRLIDAATPRPVATALAQARQAVLADGLPRLGALIDLPAVSRTAPPVNLDDPELQTAAQSVARITGTAAECSRTLTGSGFVATPERVITNAHVVAGISDPVVELPGAPALEGEVVYFDPVGDLAVIAVPELGAVPLTVAGELAAGDAAVVQGYPFGGPFTAGAASVQMVADVPVPDIYGSSEAIRRIYAMAATVQPGNSGGPVLTPDGAVAGVVFARADDGSAVGYAMTTVELMPVLAEAPDLSAPVSTGVCVR